MAEETDPEKDLDARILRRGSREDTACPSCHSIGFRRVAESEFSAIYACRKCGHQVERVHEEPGKREPPFSEFREGRRLRRP
jgi:ribosomal protein L37AE/L43A